jgi:transposase
MTEINLLAIDLAKRVFQLHGVDASGAKVFERRLMRDQLEPFVAGLPACEIAMEACGSAHDWGRRFTALGHRVRLLPPPEVARLVDRRKKNDWRDTRAIALATAEGPAAAAFCNAASTAGLERKAPPGP